MTFDEISIRFARLAEEMPLRGQKKMMNEVHRSPFSGVVDMYSS